MKCGRQGEQTLTQQVKEKPGDDQPDRALASPPETGCPRPLPRSHANFFPEASRANHPVFVLGDAFPAEIPATFRTARYGFALRVVETPLICQVRRHDSILGGTPGLSVTAGCSLSGAPEGAGALALGT